MSFLELRYGASDGFSSPYFNLYLDSGAESIDDCHEPVNRKSAKVRITDA
jgi:hypothetical protein